MQNYADLYIYVCANLFIFLYFPSYAYMHVDIFILQELGYMYIYIHIFVHINYTSLALLHLILWILHNICIGI